MEASQIYLAASIVVLAVVAMVVCVFNRRTRVPQLSPIAGLALASVLAGMFVSEERLLGYSLLAVGIVLAVIDVIRKSGAGGEEDPPPSASNLPGLFQ